MDQFKTRRVVLLTVATSLFIAGLVLNITSYQALFQVTLDVVPQLQNDIGSEGLTIFMNIISNLFNPVVCAGYIIIVYVVTCRKLEILVFLIWFILLSFVLSMLKQVLQQPRPYWVSDKIQMLEWTCYTEYGSPSGHSMLAIVLLEFLVRFLSRKSKIVAKYSAIFYFFVLMLELLVMFSRVYLGMHSINQVLFGFMVGCFSMVVYYLFAQPYLYVLSLKYLSEGITKTKNFLWMIVVFVALCLYQCLITFLSDFTPQNNPTEPWIMRIQSIPSCKSRYDFSTSFYLKCYEDMAIGVGSPIILISLAISTNGSGFIKKFSYSRCSRKFMAYLAVTLLTPLIPAAIFLNPWWKLIDNISDNSMAGLLWSLNVLGFTFAFIILVGLSPHLVMKFGLAEYANLDSYTAFKQEVVVRRATRTQTELESRRVSGIEKIINMNQVNT